MKTENKNWPDKARLKMIDIPESYPIYKHGFNDGYQYRNEQCQKQDELIKAQDELIGMMLPHAEFVGVDSYVFLYLFKKYKQLKKELQ